MTTLLARFFIEIVPALPIKVASPCVALYSPERSSMVVMFLDGLVPRYPTSRRQSLFSLHSVRLRRTAGSGIRSMASVLHLRGSVTFPPRADQPSCQINLQLGWRAHRGIRRRNSQGDPPLRGCVRSAVHL